MPSTSQPASVDDIRTAIGDPTLVAYVAFGPSHSTRWKRAKSVLGARAKVAYFRLDSPNDFDAVGWPAQRKALDGSEFGNHTPGGVFITRRGGRAYLLTGEGAKSRHIIRRGRSTAAGFES